MFYRCKTREQLGGGSFPRTAGTYLNDFGRLKGGVDHGLTLRF